MRQRSVTPSPDSPRGVGELDAAPLQGAPPLEQGGPLRIGHARAKAERELHAAAIGAVDIAEQLGIGRSSVYRALDVIERISL
jgi:hypothetical protein